jgi:hypothetical protein
MVVVKVTLTVFADGSALIRNRLALVEPCGLAKNYRRVF